MERIPVAGPWVTEKEIAYVSDAARTAWYSTANVYLERFQTAFADYIGTAHAVALPSCTSAIHLALMAEGIGPGDEVIVPDATWIASAAPISYVGAAPRFADVDSSTWCVSVETLERCRTRKTRAVIVVDLYGGMPTDFPAIQQWAKQHRIALIEDSAEALGSAIGERRAGAWGDVGVFSFHGSKTLTTGEGGMLVSDRGDLIDRINFLRDHGRAPGSKMFWNSEVAHKYKMSALQAAFGLAQLERFDELLAKKRLAFEWYRRRLAGVDGLELNVEPVGTTNSYWMVTAIVDRRGIEKEGIVERLSAAGIDSRPFFYPLSTLPAYAGLSTAGADRARNPVSARLGRLGINLPSSLMISEEQVDRVCTTLLGILR